MALPERKLKRIWAKARLYFGGHSCPLSEDSGKAVIKEKRMPKASRKGGKKKKDYCNPSVIG